MSWGESDMELKVPTLKLDVALNHGTQGPYTSLEAPQLGSMGALHYIDGIRPRLKSIQ